MSLYRSIITAVLALGLVTSAVAADKAATASATDTQKSSAAVTQKLNVNTATAKELGKVKGLTFAKARSIVAYRNKNGNFKSMDDLKSVKALKKLDEKTLKEIQEQLILG